MKTIKIIDLLNKIANGEEIPKEIKIKTSEGTIAPFYLSDDKYINIYTEYSLLECLDEFDLNDKITLDEEDEFEEFDTFKSFTCNVGRVDESNIEECIYTLFRQQTSLICNQKKIIERLNNEKGN